MPEGKEAQNRDRSASKDYDVCIAFCVVLLAIECLASRILTLSRMRETLIRLENQDGRKTRSELPYPGAFLRASL